MSSTLLWNAGEPPKDGNRYVALGNIAWSDEEGCGGALPFTETVHWSGEMWINDTGMSIAHDCDSKVHIRHWAHAPEAASR